MQRKDVAGYLVSHLLSRVFRYIAVAQVVQQDTRPNWDSGLPTAALCHATPATERLYCFA